MALPILDTATYELTLPSADVKVKYRPFLVKEEKVLLQALEANDDVEIKNAIKIIVSTCTFGQLDASNLPTFDLEYVFLQVRSKSVGEVAKIRLLCPDDKETYVTKEIDLSKVEVQVDDEHTNEIKISDKIKMIMKYPTIDTVDPQTNVKGMKTQQVFDMITGCIHSIIDGEKDRLRMIWSGGLDFLANETYVYVPEIHQAQNGGDNGFIGVGTNNFKNYNLLGLGVWNWDALDGALA